MVYPAGNTWPDATACLPILLIHGLSCSVEVWKPTLHFLADAGLNRPIYAMDLPGYGCSQGPREAFGIAELAEWTARLMNLLGIPRAHIGGNSLGCQVALALARRYPERVGALVLGGPTEGNELIPLWRMGVGLLMDLAIEPLLYSSVLMRTFFQMGIPHYLTTVHKMSDDHPISQAKGVSAPCLIVRGTRDGIIPNRAARTLAEALPHGEFQAIVGAAHAVQFNAPELFSQLALAFWEQSDSLFVDLQEKIGYDSEKQVV